MVDRISTLPDDILCHILSFLPTQDTVVTSLVSKRWKPLWRSVPSLYFDDQSHLQNFSKTYHWFQNFIYATIRARDSHQPIRSFWLKCVVESDFCPSDDDIYEWVKAATQRGGLKNLHIEVTLPIDHSLIYLSGSTISCKTLVDLKLMGLFVEIYSFVDLPSLKTLHLEDVGFDYRQCLGELLSGCPILEYMHVNDTYCPGDGYDEDDYDPPNNNNFKGLSKLVRADIYSLDDLDILLEAICNVEFLATDESLKDIPVFPNLTHVELAWGWGMKWHSVLTMLKQCPKLQNFGLNMELMSANLVWISPKFVPECLSSQLRKCSITNYDSTRFQLHFAKYIMQNSRVLQTMTIYTAPSSSLQKKFEMLKELSIYPRTCELLFK
ncbi:putative FBD-associated F-box protein At5g56440 [Lotus japonicus]|uniref:putative FBD-associated F-box protein At5g56440 n=1 Tax=Lotus japonicus TaxID=34305 RepID=UPI00258CE997|nr:putative FBD-associated F-box protein At5g56440 [Lotus japonicus]